MCSAAGPLELVLVERCRLVSSGGVQRSPGVAPGAAPNSSPSAGPSAGPSLRLVVDRFFTSSGRPTSSFNFSCVSGFVLFSPRLRSRLETLRSSVYESDQCHQLLVPGESSLPSSSSWGTWYEPALSAELGTGVCHWYAPSAGVWRGSRFRCSCR
jgi:hypothetical protein